MSTARNAINTIPKAFRKLFEAENIFEAMKPITGIMQLMGFPYNLIRKKDSEGFVIKITAYFVLTFSLGATFYTWCMYKFYSTDKIQVVDTVMKGSLFKYGNRFMVFASFSVVTLAYLSSLKDIKRYPKVALILADIESLLKPLGINKQYSRIKVNLIFACIAQSCVPYGQLILSLIQMSSWMEKLTYYEFIAMYSPSYICTVVLATYCTFIYEGNTLNCSIISSELELILKKRFLSKNEIESLFLDVDSTILHQKLMFEELETLSRDEVVFERLNKYWKIYDRICDYTESVNETFSFKVALIFGMSFGCMIFNVFITLSAVGWMTRGGDKTYFLLTYSLGQSALHYINIYLTIKFIQVSQNSVSMIAFHPFFPSVRLILSTLCYDLSARNIFLLSKRCVLCKKM